MNNTFFEMNEKNILTKDLVFNSNTLTSKYIASPMV